MKRLSTIVFNPDTTLEAERLMMKLRPLMWFTRDDALEMSVLERSTADSVEVTILVTIYTGNLEGMLEHLRENGLY